MSELKRLGENFPFCINNQKRNTMAVHHVTFTVPERDLGNSGIEFEVKKDGIKAFKLKASKGKVVWVPKDHTYGYKLSWLDFADVMKERAKRKSEERADPAARANAHPPSFFAHDIPALDSVLISGERGSPQTIGGR